MWGSFGNGLHHNDGTLEQTSIDFVHFLNLLNMLEFLVFFCVVAGNNGLRVKKQNQRVALQLLILNKEGFALF